jgi:hypothetical protein
MRAGGAESRRRQRHMRASGRAGRRPVGAWPAPRPVSSIDPGTVIRLVRGARDRAPRSWGRVVGEITPDGVQQYR